MASDARSPGTDDLPSFGNAILGDTAKKRRVENKKKKKKKNALLFISESTERAAYIGIYNGDPEIHRIIRRTRIVTNLPCYLFICLL